MNNNSKKGKGRYSSSWEPHLRATGPQQESGGRSTLRQGDLTLDPLVGLQIQKLEKFSND